MRPVIGITTFLERGKNKLYSSLSQYYINSVFKAGGIPILIPTLGEDFNSDLYIDKLDGILFSGGGDIAPRFFNENPIKYINDISSIRDEFEMKLFHAARERNLPILGICRGIQLINVALGGTLYQDINAQIKDSLGHNPSDIAVEELYHSVNIEKNTRLHDIFKKDSIHVNSFHHQSVKDVAEGLKVSAYSEDGIIEAVESMDDQFLLGVQWHPENLVERYPEFLKLFSVFVQACI